MIRITIRLLTAAFLLMSSVSKAQNCDGYFPSKKGTVLETTIYNDKGKKEGTSILTIKDIQSAGNEVRLNLQSEMKDEKDKPITQAEYDAFCSNGSFFINMKSMITSEQLKAWKDMEVTMQADDIEYPVNVAAGQKLPDAHLTVNMTMSGMKMPEFKVDITDRVVVGMETITTPAGTFECVKITSTQRFKNIVSYEANAVEWLSKGNGLIKTQSFKKDKLKSYTELTAIR